MDWRRRYEQVIRNETTLRTYENPKDYQRINLINLIMFLQKYPRIGY
jgi:hypothetical protein